jgi:hypothetical protein
MQWLGLLLAFAGMVVAFGVPAPAVRADPVAGRRYDGGCRVLWAATTLVSRQVRCRAVSPEKTLLYQICVCVPIVALGALMFGERITACRPRGARRRWPTRPSWSARRSACGSP